MDEFYGTFICTLVFLFCVKKISMEQLQKGRKEAIVA